MSGALRGGGAGRPRRSTFRASGAFELVPIDEFLPAEWLRRQGPAREAVSTLQAWVVLAGTGLSILAATGACAVLTAWAG